MRYWLITVLAFCLSACSQADGDQNPRNRKGGEGTLTWRAVNQADGQAAFLSRPGAAPDVVLWCKDGAKIVIRAHVFENPASQPDLRLTTQGGVMVFENVRRQGGVRDGDRQLVEGSAGLKDPKILAVLAAADQFVLQAGGDKYEVQASDPNRILAPFVAACKQVNSASIPPKK
jgi:hypothetical protein